MFKLFNKKRGKKGFTLAELLVVVGIIAILVAIAIPVFTRSVEDAKTAVKNANIRAVRAAAVEEILNGWSFYGTVSGSSGKTAAISWKAEALVTAAGEIGPLKITASASADSTADEAKDATDGAYQVTVHINQIATTDGSAFAKPGTT